MNRKTKYITAIITLVFIASATIRVGDDPVSLYNILGNHVSQSLPEHLPSLTILAKPLCLLFPWLFDLSHGASATTKKWNILYHLGGNGPWISKVDNVVGGGLDVPSGCRIDQVHMLSRHAERYPTLNAGIRMLTLFQRLKHANVTLQGDLSFANDWDFFMRDPSERLELLLSTGPYAGTLGAFSTGTKLRTRYEDLLLQALSRNQTSFWASDSTRVVETARYFATAFFGIDWTNISTLHVIPETAELGADTLTPGDTCYNYVHDVNSSGHAFGYRMLSEFQAAYLPSISTRLKIQNPQIWFSDADVWAMQEICGFETLTRGSSPWCDVFTHEEVEQFEYARDLLHYYRAGEGNAYGATMGWLFLNATTALLNEGPDAGPLFLSFVHDGDIVPFLAALQLFPQPDSLPTSHVLRNRTWQTSSVTPMGGRIIFERLACPAPPECWSNAPFYPNHIYCAKPKDDVYVRINVNDGIVALPGCDSGPGSSCPLDNFSKRVEERGHEVGDFGEVCGLSEDAPKRITFLHQRRKKI